MTPMIDVVFLLLVFFVCASVGQAPDDLLPAMLKGNSATAMPVPPQAVDPFDRPTIRIGLAARDGEETEIRLNAAAVQGFDDLRLRLTKLAEIAPDSRIILDVGDDVLIQAFVTTYDMCQSLGLTDISFAL